MAAKKKVETKSDDDTLMNLEGLSLRREALEKELKALEELEISVSTSQLLDSLKKCEEAVDALPKGQKFPTEVKKIVRKLNKVILGKSSSTKKPVGDLVDRKNLKVEKQVWIANYVMQNPRFTIPQLQKAASEKFTFSGSAEQYFKKQLEEVAAKSDEKDESDSRVFIWEAISKEGVGEQS